jgi:peptide-methionine (R)-S-oxide reductase
MNYLIQILLLILLNGITMGDQDKKINKTEEEWKKELSAEEYRVLREKGTEYPHTNEYNKHFEEGVYHCAGCGTPLFSSKTKYDSGSGWPAFFAPFEGQSITEHRDTSHGMIRVEVTCSNCGGHLGHVFNDGPAPTGMRYCVNSTSLDFKDK